MDSNIHVPEYLKEIAPHPTESQGSFYARIIMPIARGLLRWKKIDISVFGSEFIPATGGAVIAANHTGYYDFILGGVPAYLRGKRLMRYMAKKELFGKTFIGRLMKIMGHIPVDRSQGANSIQATVERAAAGDLVGIFPESTISRSFELEKFKTGAVRIAHEAGVPLIPMIMWGSQRIYSKDIPWKKGRVNVPVIIRLGPPVPTTGDATADTELLHESMEYMLNLVREEYAEYGPFEEKAPWLPASLGGSAPTLEEVRAQEAKARQERDNKG
ncbi:lysophospholipid acyltransferase family protein [Corynebacterium caspium]|uniref:lysophospholipid acyltransferase family protein n=1 Tax=Corynebacterium caspium TaxID=234828 RepID=UPI0003632105|nr:lysophospholipid acyltransferase family protein [Corynebacterium caspium]WKD59996.1 1-acyl-sn-glycerol-3-phosphate acyltransferase [Corynebacterium caspium DSM 44850]